MTKMTLSEARAAGALGRVIAEREDLPSATKRRSIALWLQWPERRKQVRQRRSRVLTAIEPELERLGIT